MGPREREGTPLYVQRHRDICAETITRDPSVVRIPHLTDPIKISRRDAIRETALVISPVQRVRASSLLVRLSRVGDSVRPSLPLHARFPGTFMPPSWEAIRAL